MSYDVIPEIIYSSPEIMRFLLKKGASSIPAILLIYMYIKDDNLRTEPKHTVLLFQLNLEVLVYQMQSHSGHSSQLFQNLLLVYFFFL